MILQALASYYDIIRQDPELDVARPGFSTVPVRYALNLSQNGDILDVFPTMTEVQRGKKTLEVPRSMEVPQQVKRSSGIAPNFMCDNTPYVLGVSDKDSEKPTYAAQRFQAFQKHNLAQLEGVDSDAARAVCAYLSKHDPTQARSHPAIAPHLDGLLAGGNIVFMFRGAFTHDDPAIQAAWLGFAGVVAAETQTAQCLITGETAPVARLHANVKGVRGAQSSGAALVGFNAPAYESYGKSQGGNAPASEQAVFKYTTALNYLLSQRNPNPRLVLGDTTVVYWAESQNNGYAALFEGLFGAAYSTPSMGTEARTDAEAYLGSIASKLQNWQPIDKAAIPSDLDPDTRFYVLGLAPNAARVSVRFFIRERFGTLVNRLMQHYADLSLVRERDRDPEYIPLWQILAETVSKKARSPEPPPLLTGAIMRAILSGGAYPAGLYSAVIGRVRIDMDDSDRRIQKVNYVRAAVVKAVLVRKYRNHPTHPFEEALTMSLNEQSTIPAYLLGRLFAVLEKLQQEAIPNANATIKDRYFATACATPASVFPVLLRLSQHHISKVGARYHERTIEEILSHLDVSANPIPKRLTLDEQGVFILGYYHQRKDLWTSKADKAAAQATDPNNN